jgi:Na+-driven multidrug efflux pump
MLLSLGSSLVYTLPLGYGLAIWADWGATGVFTATFSGSWISMLLMGAWVATGRWQHVTHRVSPASESAT